VSIIGGVLTAQADNTFTVVSVGHVVQGGKGFAIINGHSFSDAAYNSIRINGGTGGLQANILANVKPLTVFGVGKNNVVDLGDGTNHLQGIQGTVLLENETGSSIVNINDQGDSTARTVTVSTVARPGDTSLGQLTGVGAAAIRWDYHDTTAVNLRLGVGASTVNVQGTGVTTNIFSSGHANVNVGSGSVAGIQGALHLENEIVIGGDTVTINDQTDATTRTVTMSQITRSGDITLGTVNGLGAAQITWDYQDTSAVNLNLGSGADNINVLATGETTNITTNIFKNANATVNVGNAGFLTFIKGDLNLENDGGAVSIFINDSNSSANQVYNMDVIPGDEFVNTFGRLTSTAMTGRITWDNADTNGVTLFGSSGQDTYNIFAIRSATDIVGGFGANTFNVLPPGTSGSLSANILGPLTLEGSGVGSVLNLNDQNNPNPETFNFAISTPGTGNLTLASNPSFDLNFDNMGNGVFLATNGVFLSVVNDPSGSVIVTS
jgi:hypothetical protein